MPIKVRIWGVGKLADKSVSSFHRIFKCRCEYEKTCELLLSLFDQSASGYQQLLQSPSAPDQEYRLREGLLVTIPCT